MILPFNKIFKKALNFLAPMIVWTGCGQHKRASKVAGSALQIL
jgi:hypothetical protein